MKLSQVGERKLTYYVTKKFSIPFDDCAFLDAGEEYLLITTDMVNRKTHFPEGSTFYHMGWYAMAVNISDIAAKGGKPIAYVAAIGMPENLEKENYEEMLEGMEKCTEEYGGKLVGGDTKEADDVTIAITAFGKVRKDEAMPRKGAKPEDAVYVTGSIGRGGAALLEKNLEELLLIKPKIKEGRMLAKSKVVTSCMDLSDGLASSLYQLAKINNVGFIIYEDMLPVAEIAKKHENWLELALYYGGDYELLFTVPEEKGKELEKKMDIKRIGKVIEENKITLIKEGKEHKIEDRGYEHFRM
ncbi:MAG: thiamine-phosphate kinase [Thermoplasmata archaeon]|nr:MAG: thiamine-phosphate kinase [Thermoplasmata archaeon]HDN96081.1 thiamine-phosphate kinase [Thermoplasmatales archaeon]